jgi:hypothetical protein
LSNQCPWVVLRRPPEPAQITGRFVSGGEKQTLLPQSRQARYAGKRVYTPPVLAKNKDVLVYK